jgi:prepilin signal peptidase PulO-like enzyme (type II secretory pathway)
MGKVTVHALLNLPIGIRLALAFFTGLLVGGQLNRGIYRLAWFPRDWGPWSPPPADAPPRSRWDRLPVVGWWGLRRESAWHGRGYWIRPLLMELATGIGFAVLYWGEVDQRWLWPALPGVAAPSPATLYAQCFSHLVLVSLMLVATFIDFDEQTIPDAITVTGAVAGLLLAVVIPQAAFPTLFESSLGSASVHQLVVTSSTTDLTWRTGLGGPNSWPAPLDRSAGLALGLLGVWVWCFAILHKTWTRRRGLVKALRYLCVSVVRHRTWQVPVICGSGLSAVVVVTWLIGGGRWENLLSAIAGMCFGGGLIWLVRIVGGQALRVEAMGFGDVTLMAMIGAFLGWQAAFLIFFLAPFTAVLIAAAQRVLTGERHIAFGPYLCLAAVIVIVGWNLIWAQWANPMFSLGWFIPILLTCCLLLMGGLLWSWRHVRDAFF